MNREQPKVFLPLFLGFSLICILFLESNISKLLGYEDAVSFVAYTPFAIYLTLKLFNGDFIWTPNRKIYYCIITLGIICLIIKQIGQRENYFRLCTFYFIMPYLLAYCLDKKSLELQKYVRYIVFLLLFVEVSLAIYERLTLTVIFGDDDTYAIMRNDESWTFRASALYGHPLANAFVVMVILLQMLASNIKLRLKLIIWAFGMFGLLCFNERGNILVTFLCSLAILFYQWKSFSVGDRRTFGLLIVVIASIFIYYLQTTDIGGRLMFNDNTIHDDSDARWAAFGVFSFISTGDLLWGSVELYDRMLIVLNLAGIENGFIAIILRYGLVFGVPAIILFSFMQIRLLKEYPLFIMLVIFFAFNIVAFTNPHISNPRPWLTFITSYYAFRPIPKY